MKNIMLLLMLSCFIIPFAQGQTKKEKKAQKEKISAENFEEMKSLIGKKIFEFRGDWAYTISGQRINIINSANLLQIKNDSADIYLAYFGTLQPGSAAMNRSGTISFEGLVKNYKTSINEKKQSISVSFETTGKQDPFQFSMTIYGNGNTIVNVNSIVRTAIKYQGHTRTLQSEN